MPLRALVWDVDGTLAETEDEGHRPAFNDAFADAGLSWHWDAALYRRLLAVTGGRERILAWWREVDPVSAAAPGAAALVDRLQAAKTVHYLGRVARGAVGLRPGVARLVAEARRSGLRLAIATTTTPANVGALLTATLGPAAPGWFEVIGAGDAVPAKKPAPDIYRWVADRLGLPPGDCLAVEDGATGAQAAVAAGMPVVVARSRLGADEALPGSPLLVADLDRLGEPGAPALGRARTGRGGWAEWHGVVDVAQLRRWAAAVAD